MHGWFKNLKKKSWFHKQRDYESWWTTHVHRNWVGEPKPWWFQWDKYVGASRPQIYLGWTNPLTKWDEPPSSPQTMAKTIDHQLDLGIELRRMLGKCFESGQEMQKDFLFFFYQTPYGGFLSHRGTPSHHLFLGGVLPNKNQPAITDPRDYGNLHIWCCDFDTTGRTSRRTGSENGTRLDRPLRNNVRTYMQ